MNILATVCARAGSKGVISKNVRDFLGLPICCYTLSSFRLFLERFGDLYGRVDLAVNTDSQLLFAQIDRCGQPYIPVPRRADLAGDFASKIDVIRDTLRRVQEQNGVRYDLILDMDLTSPLRRAVDLRNVIDTLLDTPGAEVAMTVCEARRNPYFNQLTQKSDGFYSTVLESPYVARQQAPPVYDANASLYAYSPAFLLESDAIILRARLAVCEMPDTAILDIDSEKDFVLMQVLAEYLYGADGAFGEVRDTISHFYRREDFRDEN